MQANKKYTVKPVQYINVQSVSARSVTAEFEIKEDIMGKSRGKNEMQSLTANDVLPSQHHFNSGEATNGSNLTRATRDQECQTMSTEMAIDCEKSNLEDVEKGKSQPTQQSHGGSRSLLTLIRRRQQRRSRSPQQSTAVRYLQYFFAFLYFIGMSPIPPDSARKLPKWIKRLQMALFWILALTSVLQALDEFKYGWIQFRVDENMLNFVSLGFYSATLLTRIYCIKLLVTSSESASCLVQTIESINDGAVDPSSTKGASKSIVIGIGALSLVLAVVSTIFGYSYLKQWSFKIATLNRAQEFHESIFIWTSVNYANVTSNLTEKYSTNLTIRVELFAAAGNFLAFCGTMHACVLLDLWLIVSIQIFIIQFHFTNAFIETKATNRTGRCPLSIHWKYYRRLRVVSEQSDLVFGKLLKMVHMQNLFLFGYFLFQLLKKEPVSAMFLTDMFSVLKVSVTYYLVQKSTEKNEMYEQCVIDCSKCGNTIEMDGEEMNVGVLLKDMKRHPIGIGRGDFYVNETFVLKLAAAVGSVFMLLSGEIEQNKCTSSNE